LPPTQEYLGLEHLFELFGLFPAWFAFGDVAVPNKQAEMLTLSDAMAETGYTQNHPIPPSLSMFALLVSFGAPQFLDNTTFTHSLFAPSGLVRSDIYYLVFNAYRYIPLDNASAALEPQHGAHTYAVGANLYGILYVLLCCDFKLRRQHPNIPRPFLVPHLWFVGGMGLVCFLLGVVFSFSPPFDQNQHGGSRMLVVFLVSLPHREAEDRGGRPPPRVSETAIPEVHYIHPFP